MGYWENKGNSAPTLPNMVTQDLLGNRIKTVTGAVTNYHLYDGAQCIADMDATGGVTRSYVWGPGIDNLLAMSVHTGATVKTYYAITDHLGSIHALVDDTGTVVESYKFDAYGKVLGVYDSNNQQLNNSATGNRYLWQGREYSFETGFYYFRARWYDPITGRWLSKDPIGISGGLNQYVFCNNNPVNYVDPSGLDAYLLFRNGFHFTLVVGDAQNGYTGYDFAPAQDIGWSADNLDELRRGVDGKVKLSYYNQKTFETLMAGKDITAAQRIKTSYQEDSCMKKEMSRQSAAPPDYKMGNVCIQAAIGIVNHCTSVNYPTLWDETVAYARGGKDTSKIIGGMKKAADGINAKYKGVMVNDKPYMKVETLK